jgi:hypothetical protein
VSAQTFSFRSLVAAEPTPRATRSALLAKDASVHTR